MKHHEIWMEALRTLRQKKGPSLLTPSDNIIANRYRYPTSIHPYIIES